MLQRILSGFCNSIFYQGVIALCLNLHFWSSVDISTYSPYGIFRKLSQNDFHYVLQCILSGFWDSIIYQGVIALCLNLHFWTSVHNSSYSSHGIFGKLSQNDCHQVPQHILLGFCDSITYQGVIALCLYLHFLSPSIGHTLLCATPPTVLRQFEPNFHRMIVTKCRSTYCQYFAIPLFVKELLKLWSTISSVLKTECAYYSILQRWWKMLFK